MSQRCGNADCHCPDPGPLKAGCPDPGPLKAGAASLTLSDCNGMHAYAWWQFPALLQQAIIYEEARSADAIHTHEVPVGLQESVKLLWLPGWTIPRAGIIKQITVYY